MRLPLLIALLAVPASAALAQTASSRLTLREARSLPPMQLATRVFGAVGGIYREAIVSQGAFGFPDSGGIEFASVPRSAGHPGICAADLVYVRFAWGGTIQGGADRPRRPGRIETRRLYRIVGDADDRRAWTGEAERALNAQCAHTGPVFTSTAGRRFFAGVQPGGANVVMVARMLQTVIADARRGPLGSLTCAEDPFAPRERACADPRAVLIGLPVDRLSYVWLERCRASPAHLCARLSFRLAGGSRYQWREVELLIESDVERADPLPDIFHILSVAIRHTTQAV